ncbi:MAG: phenylalanine--tRNA ligase subunit beta, partial [Candidatus Saccharimonas aalborgensis]
MKVSLNLIKQFTSINILVDELVATINNQLGGVEEVTELGVRYKNITIVKVVSCEKHPNADKLSVCKIDDGQSVRDVDRDVDGYVQVVCGAPNVHANMWAVWLPPHTTVPASYADAKPFVLEPREIRGVMSNGMLGAGDELAINSDHNGIIELREEDMPPHIGARGLATGQDFAEAMGLDDTIIDIENKMFTHRPDCFGQLGVAREIAGITGQPFHSPEWYTTLPSFLSANSFELTVTNQALAQVPRFMAVGFSGIEVKPSPLWLQCELIRLGSKAINNIVDVTNYVMLLTAQPTHAYDYDKLRGHALGARMASSGEKVTLLNGKTYELSSDDIVIADQEGPVGLAGIMGGSNSEVSDMTTSIVLEVATFDMYTVRKSSMRHGVFSDALTRFNKGQSPQQN